MSVWAVVVAAGRGERFGERKQYARLAGRRVLDWALEAARSQCDGVVVVVPADVADRPEAVADVVVAGGDTRSASVRAGLGAVPADADVIVVHDGARPVPIPRLWHDVVAAVRAGADAAVPVVPVTDTLRARDGGTVPRDRFLAVQTPQAFRAAALRAAHATGAEGTDDASLVEAVGGTVALVDGDPANVKVTAPVDLVVVGELCR